jgi:hypothetical protein
VVYPEREDDYHQEYDEEKTTTSGHPDDGWYTYQIKRYHIPDPDEQEIGCIELTGEGSSYDVTLSIRRAKPLNRAYNAYSFASTPASACRPCSAGHRATGASGERAGPAHSLPCPGAACSRS